WIDIKNRKPINRFPIVSHQKDRSTDPYLIYIALLRGFFIESSRKLSQAYLHLFANVSDQ
ncbi:hypothetical protein CRN62_17055, partial [Vibrio vulnificus]